MMMPKHERRPINLWDSFETSRWDGDGPGRVYLFGNANIGALDLCNLSLPGCLSIDENVAIMHVYARTDGTPRDWPSDWPQPALTLHQWASRAVVELVIGDRRLRAFALSDLLQERPWEPGDVALARAMSGGAEELAAYQARAARRQASGPGFVPVPVRVNTSVEVCAPERPPPGLRIWIHLEGYRSRPW